MTERREDLEGLDLRAMAALRAFRDEDDMPPDARERVWARVGAGTAATAGPSGQVGSRRSSRTWAVVLLAAAAAVLLASQVGVLGPRLAARDDAAAAFAGPPAEPAPVVARAATGAEGGASAESSVTPVEPAAPVEPVHVPEDRAEATGPIGKAPAPAPRKATPEPPEARGADGLVEEAEALARAQAAIAGERPEDALRELAGYARRFPKGALREEHDALRAIALCAAGREREGRGAAQVFLREREGSALAERVRGACLAAQ